MIEQVKWEADGLELFIRGGQPGQTWQAGRSLNLVDWTWFQEGSVMDESGWTVRDNTGRASPAAFYRVRLWPGE
jgi:hypothetical protein